MTLKNIAVWAIVELCLAFTIYGVSFGEQKGGTVTKATAGRGEYLVTLGTCSDCHSPKKMTPAGLVPDETRLLSGQPADENLPVVPSDTIGPGKWGALANNNFTGWVGVWGTSYASNLSPDAETGIGAWNLELFIRIMRTGKFMGSGRPILPPMPWQAIGKLSDPDLKAIFSYLKSLNPVKNQVPASVPTAPQ